MNREPRSILIIRLSAIGDVVMASPLVKALRLRYPEAYIAWLTQPEAAGLLAANTALDEVIIWPRGVWGNHWRQRQWGRLTQDVVNLVHELRARQFDWALDAQGLLKSGVWAWASRATTRIGVGSREGSGHLMTRTLAAPKDDPLIASEYRLLAQSVDATLDDWSLDLSLSSEDRTTAEKLLGTQQGGRGYVALCPFTTRPQKHWLEDRWHALARRITTKLGLSTVVLGGSGDRRSGDRIAHGSGATNLAGKTSLRQAAAILERATAVIGVDTGLTHMAILMRIPTVALFGSTKPYLDTGQSNSRVLYKALPCSPCRRRPSCGREFGCMKAILMEDVEDALLGVVA